MGDINIKQLESLRWRMRGDRDADRDRDSVDRLDGLPEEGRTGLLFGGSRSPSIPVKVLYAIPSAKKTVRL